MKKILAVIIIFILLVFGFVLYFYRNVKEHSISDEERKKALAKLLGRDPVLQNKKSSTKWIKYSDENIEFSYPENADIHVNYKNPPLLTSFQYGIRDPYVNISVQVLDIKSLDLADDSAVNLREKQTDIYKKSTKTLNGNDGVEFVKTTDGVEKSSFFAYKGRAYSIVATGFDLSDTDALYEKELATVKFK